MDTILWILQGALAVVFLGSGIAKSTMSRERMIATGQTGIAMFPMPVVRVTAASELLAAAGLLLPWAIGIAPWLTPTAPVPHVLAWARTHSTNGVASRQSSRTWSSSSGVWMTGAKPWSLPSVIDLCRSKAMRGWSTS